jgi:spore coat protein U-like protein
MNTRQVISTAAAIALLGAQAHATTADVPLNVNITLTSACTVTTPGAIALAYTSRTNSPVSATGSGGTITCTHLLPFTMFLDNRAGGQISTASYDYTDLATNLTYRLTLNSAPSPGTGAAQSYSVEGFIGADQAGKCATAQCIPTIAPHTVYVNY